MKEKFKITANHITLVRVVLMPLVVILLVLGYTGVFPSAPFFALGVFVICGITDIADGLVARRTDSVTLLGKFLDPMSDKIFINAILITLIFMGSFTGQNRVISIINMICIIVMFTREFLIGTVRQVAAGKKVIIAADVYGKVKTVLLFVSFATLILALYDIPPFFDVFSQVMQWIGIGFFYVATVIATVSGARYYWDNKRVLFELLQEERQQLIQVESVEKEDKESV